MSETHIHEVIRPGLVILHSCGLTVHGQSSRTSSRQTRAVPKYFKLRGRYFLRLKKGIRIIQLN